MKKIVLLLGALLLLLGSVTLQAQNKEYYGSAFGIRSNGTTDNTSSLQRAVDYISEQGGGTLVLWVGRYLTGSIELKSNVTIQLNEGAVLVSAKSPYAFNHQALIWAENQENIAVIGQGVLEGSGKNLRENCATQTSNGYYKDGPVALIRFSHCKNVKVDGILLQNPMADAMCYSHCENVSLSNLNVFPLVLKGNNSVAAVFDGGKEITVSNCYFEDNRAPFVTLNETQIKVVDCKRKDGATPLVSTVINR